MEIIVAIIIGILSVLVGNVYGFELGIICVWNCVNNCNTYSSSRTSIVLI